MAHLTINIGDQVEPPIVHDNFIYLNSQEYLFGVNSFIKEFVDPEGGTYDLVTIKSLIGINGLEYNSSPILINDSFPVANSGLFKFTLASKYSIHNGVLYEYTKDIDAIIADYNFIGLELVANTNGLLTFIEPLNLANIQYVQGVALPNTTLSFKFTTSSTISGLPSNEATFSMIPWENVNLKDNFYSLGGGTDGDSAYQVALNNGFVGTQPEWLASLVGAQGLTGENGAAGADGVDGTSVTILGSYATLADLQAAQPTGTAGDSYLVNGYLYVWNGSAWENVGLIQGPRGYDGRGLEYVWNGTSLGVRYEGQINYNYVDLKGATGATGMIGPKGDQGLQGLKGDTGAQGIQGIQGIKGDTGTAGTNGTNGLSAYQVWLANGNSGTVEQYLLSLKGAKGDTGAKGTDAAFTHTEYPFDWLTGQSQIFTVPDANAITDVYVDGKRAEKNNPNGSPDEWTIHSATEIRIIPSLNNNDRVTIIESAKYSYVIPDDVIKGVNTSTGVPLVPDENKIVTLPEITGGGNAEYPAYIFDGYKHINSTPTSSNEPHFVTMPNGNILMTFRSIVDQQWHQGNGGYVAGRISTDEGKTFGTEFTIYNDEYDNRNTLPGVLPDGRVIVIFYTSNVISPSNVPFIAMSYVTSSDNGVTWSAKTDIVAGGASQQIPHGKILTRGTDVVFLSTEQGAEYKISLWTSTDSFATLPTSSLIITDPTATSVEPVMVDLPDGKSIILTRNNTNAVGAKSFYQYNSPDGLNFTFKGMTNIYGDKDYSVQTSPHAIIDSRGKMIVIAPQRLREFYTAQDINADTVTRVYIQDPLDVYNSELAYELKHEIPRPIPCNNSFYGYPDAIEVSDGILVGLCDKYYYEPTKTLNNFNEMANIFTFMLYPVADEAAVKALGIEDIGSPVQNNYNLLDRVDLRTISGQRNLVNYLHRKEQYKIISNIGTSVDFIYSYKLYYLRVVANITLTLPSYIHTNHIEFEGWVSGDYTLTIQGDANMTINGVLASSYILTKGQSFLLKMVNDRIADLVIKGGTAINKTGTVLSLANTKGNTYNYTTPSATLGYTTKELAVNGFARCFINATSEPAVYLPDGVTLATKVTGSTFEPSVVMEMVVESPNGLNVEYYFVKR